jgi:predicted phosphoribosyltransferase
MLVAARYVRSLQPRRTLIAVPVGSVQACHRLRREADDCVCLATPEPFTAVGEWYADFRQVTDAEVQHILEQNRLPTATAAQPELQKL